MSEQKHTPGPWEVSGATHIWSPTAHANVASVSEPRGEGSDVGYQPLKRNSPDFEEACANARLIAAAPDLLEALSDVLDAYEYALQYKGDYFTEKHGDALVVEQARAAIKKAKGESTNA